MWPCGRRAVGESASLVSGRQCAHVAVWKTRSWLERQSSKREAVCSCGRVEDAQLVRAPV